MSEQQSNQHPNQAHRLAASHAGELKNLVGSEDGQKVKKIMEGEASQLKEAVQKGDMATLKRTFDHLMRTEEGARLIGKIQDMMK